MKLSDIILKNRVIKTTEHEIVKINIGCGLTSSPEYYSLDGSLFILLSSKITFFNKIIYKLSGGLSKFYTFDFFDNFVKTHKVYYCNFNNKRLPFKDNSVDIIYSSHFLEHVNGRTGFEILKECHRILKDNGKFRISLPCMDKAMIHYNNKSWKKLNNFFYAANDDSFHSHRYAYNAESLTEILYSIGFKNIIKSYFKAEDFEDAFKLDSREDESFYLTITK
jgi:predicted SAM-dependent methyltransferase